MSFAKAVDLVRLARMAARHRGVDLQEICNAFDVSHRTAQRMTAALKDAFGQTTETDGDDRRRRWRLKESLLAQLQPRQESALEALEIAVKDARDHGRATHAAALEGLHDDILARLGAREARRTEADVEAVLTAVGQVARPGPKADIPSGLFDTVIAALRGPFLMRLRYGQPDADERVVEPHGLLFGNRSYLVARDADGKGAMRKLRLDRIHEPSLLAESFLFKDGFSLEHYAAQGFGVFSDPEQYAEVIWRFAPEAAERARQFRFHPSQVLEPQPDGGLIVRFHASGWTEMAWHLYQWGDTVEVIAPEGLKIMTHRYRRSDFDALP